MAILNVAIGLLGQHRWDTIVDHVDNTADGPATIEQGGRSAHDFNTISEDRFDRHRVVSTDI